MTAGAMMRICVLTAALALTPALVACNNASGTLTVSLITAPGSTVLDSAQTLDVFLTNPSEKKVVTRGGSGFQLEIDVTATNSPSALIIDALDGSGTLIATGTSPPFLLGAINGELAIYMAPPNSMGASPSMLDAARTGVAITAVSFGVAFAGGVDASGSAGTELALYNTFDHSLTQGSPMPAARSNQAIADGSEDILYLFGGDDGSGNPTSSFWSFNTGVAPSGAYDDFSDSTGFSSVSQLALPIDDNDDFVVSGTPPVQLAGLSGSATQLTQPTTLQATGAATLNAAGSVVAVFVSSTGIATISGSDVQTYSVAAAQRTGASVTALPSGAVLVACGGSNEAVAIDVATGSATTYPSVPATARTGCAAAATAHDVVIAGGTDGSGAVVTTADVFDATTLAPVASVPLVVPRTGATAIALSNDQVLIAGGVDSKGAPIATIELFTPAPLE